MTDPQAGPGPLADAHLAALAERYGPPVREWHDPASPAARRHDVLPVTELDVARHRRTLLAGIQETRWFIDLEEEVGS